MNSNYLYIVDPETGEILSVIDRYSWNYYQWKHGVGIEPDMDCWEN